MKRIFSESFLQFAFFVCFFWSLQTNWQEEGLWLWLLALVTDDRWHITGDIWQVTFERWHLKCTMWHVTHDTWCMARDKWLNLVTKKLFNFTHLLMLLTAHVVRFQYHPPNWFYFIENQLETTSHERDLAVIFLFFYIGGLV